MVACSDPRAAMHGHVPTEAGSAPGEREGRCFLVTPDQAWESIARIDGMSPARRTPASPGEPPLFFGADDLLPGPTADRRVPGKLWVVLLLALLALPFRLLRWLLRWLLGGLRPGSRSGDKGKRRRALVLADAEIDAQRDRLRVRRLQLVIVDPYGTRDMDKWTREKAYFCKSRVLRSLAARGLTEHWPAIAREVDRRIERAASPPRSGWRRQPRRSTRDDPGRFDPRMSPTDYERHCALLLRKAGWEAEVTVASGDQGTDVLARRGKRSLVLQCKLYSKPVGNSAVQQIAAARLHHRADFAAVVSNADFTRRARELAATNGVYLLHHEELRDFPPRG